MKAIIIGGGIGGAMTALALIRQGVDIELYEQAAQFDEIGAGLQLSANAVRVLEQLGLGEDLHRIGVAAEAVEFRDLRSDDLLHHTPLGHDELGRLGAEFVQAQRPDLLDIIVNRIPSDVIHLGQRYTRFEQDDNGVTAHFISGETAHGDVIIGADGIHSLVRDQILGIQKPEFSKIIAWRALIPHDRIQHLRIEPKCHVWFAPGHSVVLYWVRQMELLNFVGIVPSEEAEGESWTKRGTIQAVRDSYQGSANIINNIIDEIQDPFVTGYYFRYPLSKWSVGRATILGDAAHPMHPFLAQGACQAIEDAAVLSHVLAVHSDHAEQALMDYEHKRLPRASRVQRSSMDQERVWHMAEPTQIAVRNRQLKSMMQIDPRSRALFGWIHEHDPYALAQRPYGSRWEVLQRPEAQRAWKMWDGFAEPDDVARGYHGLRDAYHRFLRDTFPPPSDARIDERTLGTVATTRVQPPEAPKRTSRILHAHGGGYVCGRATDSGEFAYRLAQTTQSTVDAVEYRRAPENPFPAAIEDFVAAYQGLLEHEAIRPDEIVFSGESAGGALAIAGALLAQQRGLPAPGAIVSICPMADLTLSSTTIDERADEDPICTREFLTNMASLYLQNHPPGEPLASPLHSSLDKLPPLLVQSAENEALFGDAHRLVQNARKQGNYVQFDTYPDTVHVFPLFSFLPEADQALDQIGRFVGQVSERR